MVFDRLFEWRDRRWLDRNGMEHDIELDDALEEELSASDVRAMDETLSVIDDALDDYDTGIYEVEELDDDSEAAGRYNGRSRGRPQIELDPSATSIAPLWAHEVGHDISSVFGMLPDDDRLVRKTFDEAVAYLTAYHAMDELDRDEPSWLGPFRYTHRPEWDRLREAATPDRYDALDEVEDAIERRDWRGMADAADALPLVPPGEDAETASMVASYLGDEREQELSRLTGMWRDMEYAADDEAAWRLLEACDAPEGPADERLAATVARYDADRLEDIYSEVMQDAVEETVDELRGREAGELDGGDVVALFADETYGYTGVGHDGYDDYLDLPHSVGHELAEELYDAGVGLQELAEDHEVYAGLAREALEYTVDHALEGGTLREYDLGELL